MYLISFRRLKKDCDYFGNDILLIKNFCCHIENDTGVCSEKKCPQLLGLKKIKPPNKNR